MQVYVSTVLGSDSEFSVTSLRIPAVGTISVVVHYYFLFDVHGLTFLTESTAILLLLHLRLLATTPPTPPWDHQRNCPFVKSYFGTRRCLVYTSKCLYLLHFRRAGNVAGKCKWPWPMKKKSYDHDTYSTNKLHRIDLRPIGETRRNAYDVESTVLTTFSQKTGLLTTFWLLQKRGM